MNIVIVGHVDHGKSSVIGRLLADTDSLPKGKLEGIREMCRRNDKPFEYAYLLDALKDERSQGITIDTARCFFKTALRDYIIIDAPGHIEFLKNMITGASRAEAALLVIDAMEGVRENSRRHGYMLSMLGINQIAVLVNKMDAVGYDRSVYESIKEEFSAFLKNIDVTPCAFIPVSARCGDNIAHHSAMEWYTGHTVLETLDDFSDPGKSTLLPFRMPVQDVYKFASGGDKRRIIAGTVNTGTLNAGDEVVFYPSGKRTRVSRIEPMTDREQQGVAEAGYASGFTMTEQIYAKRGDLCCKAGQLPPKVSDTVKACLFWLGKENMVPGKRYYLKTGAQKLPCRLEKVISAADASTLESSEKSEVGKFDVATCILKTEGLCAFDLVSDLPLTGRFVIVDGYDIAGGGIFLDSLDTGADEGMSLSLQVRDGVITLCGPTGEVRSFTERDVDGAYLAVMEALVQLGIRPGE